MNHPDSAPKKEICPICNLPNSVGDCGHNRFFCSWCSIEFKVKAGGVEVYELMEDGGVMLSGVIATNTKK